MNDRSVLKLNHVAVRRLIPLTPRPCPLVPSVTTPLYKHYRPRALWKDSSRTREAREEAKSAGQTAWLVLRSSKAVYISAWLDRRAGREEIVPKLLHARAPQNIEEEPKIRKLAGSRHARSEEHTSELQ